MKKSTIVFLVALGVIMVLIVAFIVYARLTAGVTLGGTV
jgi:hypothetical protein